MKKGILLILIFSVALSVFQTPIVQAKTPVEIISSTVKIFVNRESIDNNRKGSGFFVDPAGCLLTDAHIIINNETGKPFEKIEIAYPRDFRLKPEIIGPARAVFYDFEIDFAVLCLDTPEFFPALDVASAEEVEALNFGDDLKIVGFPVAGSDTVTYAPSTIIGFWNKPDLKSINGAEKVNINRVNLIKTNGISGVGGSGSPVINKNDHVVAIMFAGQNFSAVPGLSITADAWRNWRDKVQEFTPPGANCLYDPLFDFYVRDSNTFYDNQCRNRVDKNLESVVQANFNARCPGTLESWKLKNAVQHIQQGSSIDKWFEYLIKVCPVAPSAPIAKPSSKILPKTIKPAIKIPLTKTQKSSNLNILK